MSPKTIRRSCLALCAVLALTAAACHKKAEEAAAPAPAPPQETAPAQATAPAPAPAAMTVVSLTLGNAIGADKKVTKEEDTFKKGDTIYAAVGTTGAASSAKLAARWSYEGKSGEKLVKEDSQDIAPTGDATTEFHISKPDGWPAGDYKVEILLDGKSVATKAFRVA